MQKPHNIDSVRVIRALLILSAFIFILSSVLFNGFLLGLIAGQERLSPITIKKMGSTRLYFLAPGLIMLLLSECVRKISSLRAAASNMILAKILLVLFLVLQPFYMLECALDPFTPKSTGAIFIEDNELGWKLRPKSENRWGGKWIKINGKGLRGPELDYIKDPNVIRILYLGDSVAFGWGVESYKNTFPYQIENTLENDLGYNIETVNSGVGGYSTSQEYLYLQQEGIKYNPDLVVLAFVLNDVSGEFALTQSEGSGLSFQLWHARFSTRKGLIRGSSIMYVLRKFASRFDFRINLQSKAEANDEAQEQAFVNVRSLAFHPDDPDVNKAWNFTLEKAGKIFSFCKDNNLPIILVVLPYSFQFADVDALSAPQNRINQFALNHQIPTIDLLLPLAEKLKQEKLTPSDYFFDEDHLTALGANRVAQIITDFLLQKEIIQSLK
jgi:lysophospholipase L1-like esterase